MRPRECERAAGPQNRQAIVFAHAHGSDLLPRAAACYYQQRERVCAMEMAMECY